MEIEIKILGLLILAKRPLSQAEIEEKLKLDSGSSEENLHNLKNAGFIEMNYSSVENMNVSITITKVGITEYEENHKK